MRDHDPMKLLLNDSFPASAPSAELIDRVMRLSPKSSGIRTRFWLVAGSMAAAGGAIALVAMAVGTPATALADDILRQVKNFHGHILTYTLQPGGKRVLAQEVWTEPGKARSRDFGRYANDMVIDTDKGIDVYWNSTMHCFVFHDMDTKRRGQFGDALAQGTLESIWALPEFKSKTAKTGQSEFNGKPADFVDLTTPNGHLIWYAEPSSHRVVGYQSEMAEDDPSKLHWVRVGKQGKSLEGGRHMITQLSVFDDAIPDPKLFEPVFDVDGQKVDPYRKRDEIQHRLSSPIATYAIPGGAVEIRDVTRNTHGDVFVLYTAPKGEQQIIAESVSDGSGGVYVRGGGFRPYDIGSPDWPGFEFDGRWLLGNWFVRVAGKPSSGPVTLAFNAIFGGSAPVCKHTQIPTQTSGLLPDTMPFMRLGVNPHSYQRELDEHSAEYFTQTAPDYPRAAELWRRVIAETNPDAPQLGVPMPHFWLARCLEHLGRNDEALAHLKTAEALDRASLNPINPQFEQEVRVVERSLGSKR